MVERLLLIPEIRAQIQARTDILADSDQLNWLCNQIIQAYDRSSKRL